MNILVPKISEILKKTGDIRAADDLLSVLNSETADAEYRKYAQMLQNICQQQINKYIKKKDLQQSGKWVDMHRRVLKAGSPYLFDMYLQYMEWNREPRKKFYAPRRKQLLPLVSSMQDLEDDKLDILALSLPPGVGKTTLAIFYLTWIAGRHPELPSLTGSHSNSFIRGTYDECLRIFDPKGEYLYREVFPGVQVVKTNAKDCRIDLGNEKRFETLQFTSIGTGNAGLYRAAALLYCDDLVSGLEVAMSKERLDKLWDTYTTDLRQRKIGDRCKQLHIATRWSVHDVIGRLERQYEGNPRARFIARPALDENDESNFDYPFSVGFNTAFYREQREIMTDINWKALYMNEPIEREGLLYHPQELRYYFDLPDREPDAILSICDTKDKGTDYCVMPIGFKYGNDIYIEDFLCDNSNPDVVDQRLVQILLKYKVQQSRFESNSAGGRVAADVQEQIKKRGGRTKITTKFTTANKETKIIVSAGYVKDRFLFKDKSVRSKEYQLAMTMLTGWTMAGRNKHDDVPDAIAMLADFVQGIGLAKIEVMKRPF